MLSPLCRCSRSWAWIAWPQRMFSVSCTSIVWSSLTCRSVSPFLHLPTSKSFNFLSLASFFDDLWYWLNFYELYTMEYLCWDYFPLYVRIDNLFRTWYAIVVLKLLIILVLNVLIWSSWLWWFEANGLGDFYHSGFETMYCSGFQPFYLYDIHSYSWVGFNHELTFWFVLMMQATISGTFFLFISQSVVAYVHCNLFSLHLACPASGHIFSATATSKYLQPLCDSVTARSIRHSHDVSHHGREGRPSFHARGLRRGLTPSSHPILSAPSHTCPAWCFRYTSDTSLSTLLSKCT